MQETLAASLENFPVLQSKDMHEFQNNRMAAHHGHWPLKIGNEKLRLFVSWKS